MKNKNKESLYNSCEESPQLRNFAYLLFSESTTESLSTNKASNEVRR